MPRTLRIGTRGSLLALWQARHVSALLERQGQACEIRVITTTGDKILDRPLDSIGGKGLFLKEIEEALVAGEVDLAVHSLKDVPTEQPDGLALRAFLPRADPRDALVASYLSLETLPPRARVGTTSPRRRALLRSLRPDLTVMDLRGNVDTRLRKLREGNFDAILLAAAGLERLGRKAEMSEALDPEVFVPAPGQGIIALEARIGDEAVSLAVQGLNDAAAERAAAAERSLLAELGGGCNLPLGAYGRCDGPRVRLVAFVGREDGSHLLRGERDGEDPLAVGRALAGDLLARGASDLIGP